MCRKLFFKILYSINTINMPLYTIHIVRLKCKICIVTYFCPIRPIFHCWHVFARGIYKQLGRTVIFSKTGKRITFDQFNFGIILPKFVLCNMYHLFIKINTVDTFYSLGQFRYNDATIPTTKYNHFRFVI